MAVWQSGQDAYAGGGGRSSGDCGWSTTDWCDCGGGSGGDTLQMLHDIQINQYKMQESIDMAVAQADSATSLLNARVEKLDVDKEFESWCKLELRKQSFMLSELYKMLRAQSPVLRVPGNAVGSQADSSPVSGSRRSRPRSGSLPPILSCRHHDVGNADTEACTDIYGMTLVASASEAGPWWSHLSAVLLYNKAPLNDALWEWFSEQFAKKKIVLFYYYTANVRHFMLKCTCCDEQFIMCYDKYLPQELKDARVMDFARFTQCTVAAKSVGSCPRLRSDNLLAICTTVT